MKRLRRPVVLGCLLTCGAGLVWACAFDDSLREYLNARFWLPFTKREYHFARSGVQRISAPFAGMGKAEGGTPLAKLRATYQGLTRDRFWQVIPPAMADPSLTAPEREEVELIDAKVSLFAAERGGEDLGPAKAKLSEFLRKARTPEYLSEARGWLARAHYLEGNQTAAGKIYLDELNRSDSNLSRRTLIQSLRLTYGYDGGPQLVEHLDEYFDTPEHAAFAIHLITNPRSRRIFHSEAEKQAVVTPPPYERIKKLLERNAHLFRSEKGAAILTLLGMRTALRAGDPSGALRIAATVLASSTVRREPDFQWMLGSAHFLSRNYAGAEKPLLRLFNSRQASSNERAAAAYALCGVYSKTGNQVEQIRFALWLNSAFPPSGGWVALPTGVGDMSVYWAVSGWDLGMLLDIEASIDTLRAFLEKYPHMPGARLVKYSLAVRLAREHQYDEAAALYDGAKARHRAERMRRLGELYRAANRADGEGGELLEAKFKFAEFIAANPERIYFNDRLWGMMQRYALGAATDARLTRVERQKLMAAERKLKDDQEERWRAYRILREVALQSGDTELGRRAARLGIQCVRGISTDRFKREDEIRAADVELSRWLKRAARAG